MAATCAAALMLTAVVYAPMFTGRIPFPAQFVFDFPPFAKAQPPGEQYLPETNIGDLVTSFYPYRTLAARIARQWTLPLWNPNMLSGAPFLANTQSALFYPPNFLYYVLPVPVAWAAGFLLRRVLAVVFTFMFVRRIGGSGTGALVAGLVFGFCGFLTAWQGQSMSDAATWLPLVCYSVVRLRSEPTGRSAAIAAMAFAMPVLAGHPETALHVSLTGVALAGVVLFSKAAEQGRANAARVAFIKYFAGAGLLAMGIAAVQMLPTVEWFNYINHSLSAVWPPRPTWTMLSFVSRDIIRTRTSIGLLMPEEAGYLAMMVFAAAPLAFLHSSRRMAIFFGLWTAAAISAAFGIGPGYWIARHVPVLSMMKNSRAVLISSFGFAVLTGLGISALESFTPSETLQRRFRAGFLLAAGLSIGLTMIYVARLLPMDRVEFWRLPKVAFFLMLASGLLVAWRILGGFRGGSFQFLVIGLVALDVGTVSFGAIPFTRPRDIFPPIPLFERIPKSPDTPFRVAQIGSAFGANFELLYGLSAVGGYEVPLERLKLFLKDVTRNEMDSVMLTADGVLDSKDRRIDMLNAKYVVVSEWESRYKEFHNRPDRFRFLFTTDDTDVYENLRSLPAAFIVLASGIQIIPNKDWQLARMKSPQFDPERQVILREMPEWPKDGANASEGARIRWISREANSFELDVDAPEKSVLVVSQTAYPGWKARVDGESVAIIDADYAFPAIPVSAGKHHVRFSFEPLSFRVGLGLTVVSLIFCVASKTLSLWESRPPRSASPIGRA